MTVAAVVIVPEPSAAFTPADGEPALRRIGQTAWSGGALPTVVVASQVTDDLRAAVAELGGTLASPTPDEPHGIAWFVAGMRAAVVAVAETSAALLWPFKYVWVDPETVTSLVEAHGATPDAILRPVCAGKAGFPILIPVAYVERLAALAGQHGEEAVESLGSTGVPIRQIELGDPGITHDISIARGELPRYAGPPEPAGGPPPDWNAALAAQAADPPG